MHELIIHRMANRKARNLDEKALKMAPKTLSRGFLLQQCRY